LEVPINDGALVLLVGKQPLAGLFFRPCATGGIPFPPTAHGTYVDGFDFRFPRVPFSEGSDEPLVIVEEQWIVVIREDVAIDRNAIDPFIEQPFGSRPFVHSHDAKCEGLSLADRLPDYVIHQAKVVLSL
jgi:hypothetical protein